MVGYDDGGSCGTLSFHHI